MRRRTQAEMDQLVARAGFRKLDQRIDEWGIFTVPRAAAGVGFDFRRGRSDDDFRARLRTMARCRRRSRLTLLREPAMSPAPGRPWRRAFAWLLFLAPFFFVTYGLANWTAAQRADVPSLVFGWERAIPFWAWTILPYWSIDALYGLSLFVCTSRRELDTHARRLLTAQLVAVACFVAVPLRYSFDRPDADGVVRR